MPNVSSGTTAYRSEGETKNEAVRHHMSKPLQSTVSRVKIGAFGKKALN